MSTKNKLFSHQWPSQLNQFLGDTKVGLDQKKTSAIIYMVYKKGEKYTQYVYMHVSRHVCVIRKKILNTMQYNLLSRYLANI